MSKLNINKHQKLKQILKMNKKHRPPSFLAEWSSRMGWGLMMFVIRFANLVVSVFLV